MVSSSNSNQVRVTVDKNKQFHWMQRKKLKSVVSNYLVYIIYKQTSFSIHSNTGNLFQTITSILLICVTTCASSFVFYQNIFYCFLVKMHCLSRLFRMGF